MSGWFVYLGDGRHVWRFVYFAAAATSGEVAIDQALAEAEALGNEPHGDYMAVPSEAIVSRRVASRPPA